jgi:hypothetical protein
MSADSELEPGPADRRHVGLVPAQVRNPERDREPGAALTAAGVGDAANDTTTEVITSGEVAAHEITSAIRTSARTGV